MEKVEKFNKENLTTITTKIDEFLKQLEKETGIKLEMGNIKFDANQFKTSLVGKTPIQTESLSSDDPRLLIGRKFKHNESVYIIVDYKPRNPKQQIIFEDKTGSKFRTNIEFVRKNLID